MEKEKEFRSPKSPQKKGHLVRLEDGSTALVNENGQAFKVSNELLGFWALCDGSKSEHDLKEYIKQLGYTEEEVKEALVQVVESMKEANLLE